MNDEMGKRNTTQAIKQQTNQNKLIGMEEFLQSLFAEELASTTKNIPSTLIHK